MKTALITGSEGFVGRHMVAELDRRGYSLECLDIEAGTDAHDWFRDEEWIYDLVVHAAAVSPHREAIDRRPEIFPANVSLDADMFEWAIRTQQRRVLYFSSSAAYPIGLQSTCSVACRLHEDLIGEFRVPEPDSSYGWTKFIGERMAQAARQANVPVTVVRPFSGYGEDQSQDFPFAALVERARRLEDPYTIWGSGNQVRDWIHIDDIVAGALTLVDEGVGGPVNLCTGRGVSMYTLAMMACTEMDYLPSFEFKYDKPSGVEYRVGDPTILHQYYTPQITLEDGVKRALLTE